MNPFKRGSSRIRPFNVFGRGSEAWSRNPVITILVHGTEQLLSCLHFHGRATVGVAEHQNDESASATLLNEPSSTVTLHCKAGDCPQPGERRVLVKYLAKEGAYRSVLEQHYLDTRVRINKLRLQHKQHLNGYST